MQWSTNMLSYGFQTPARYVWCSTRMMCDQVTSSSCDCACQVLTHTYLKLVVSSRILDAWTKNYMHPHIAGAIHINSLSRPQSTLQPMSIVDRQCWRRQPTHAQCEFSTYLWRGCVFKAATLETSGADRGDS